MSSSVAKLQLTLAVLKPDVVAHPFRFQAVKEMILESKLLVVRSASLTWSRSDAERFYAEHKGKFFYNRLLGFMTSGPMCAQILAGDNVIARWRQLMGPTKTARARYEKPESKGIRGHYGLTDTRNAVHGSDSPDTAAREINFFFPEFNCGAWFEEEEPLFRTGEVDYCAEREIHIPKCATIQLGR